MAFTVRMERICQPYWHLHENHKFKSLDRDYDSILYNIESMCINGEGRQPTGEKYRLMYPQIISWGALTYARLLERFPSHDHSAFILSLAKRAIECAVDAETLINTLDEQTITAINFPELVTNDILALHLKQFVNQDGSVSINFFAERMNFTQAFTDEKSPIIAKTNFINAELSKHPARMYELSPLAFEKYVASLCLDAHFRLELTKQTRDGGYDILALTDESSGEKILIECKRYAKERKVGVELVRALLGTVVSEDADRGLIVTTSQLSDDAKEFVSKNAWALEARDFESLLAWLRAVQAGRMKAAGTATCP